MKKKIFLVSLMIAVFFVVFAMSAFADDIVVQRTEDDEYGTVIQLSADPGLDNAKEYVSTLNKINDSGNSLRDYCIMTDGTYFYVFPSSYIVRERSDKNAGRFELYSGSDSEPGLAQAMAEFNKAMNTSYYEAYKTSGSGGGTYFTELVRFEFPSDVTFANADYGCMRAFPKLIEVRFNREIDLGSAKNMFQNSKKLTTVIGLENVNSSTFPTGMFLGCTALEYVKLPTDLTKIPSSTFQNCGKVTIANLSELTQLTVIESFAFDSARTLVITLPDSVTTIKSSAFGSAFKDGGSITINPTSQLSRIETQAFSDCGALKSIYIPSTVTFIGERAFQKSSSLKEITNFENCQLTVLNTDVFYNSGIEVIKLPKGLTTINGAFRNTKALKVVYIPSTVTTVSDTFTETQPSDAIYYFIGKDASVFKDCTRLNGANTIYAKEYNASNTYTGVNLVVGYSNCVTYKNNNHAEAIIVPEITTYLENVKIHQTCSECEMALETYEISAIFVCQGYSASQMGNGGMLMAFAVNQKSLKEYEEVTGHKLSFGLFAGLKQKLGTSDAVTLDGNAQNGAICADYTTRGFDIIEIKVSGFKTDEHKAAQIALGAYVIATRGEKTEISYLQDKNPLEGEKYVSRSYNNLIG